MTTVVPINSRSDAPVADTMPEALINIETEAALLGAMMIDNRLVDPICERVDEQDFYEPLHARIFSVIVHEVASGRTANPVLLRNHFEGDPGMRELGVGYLAQLTGSGVAVLAARDFANSIADLAKRRRLYEQAKAMAADLSSMSSEPVDVLVDRMDSAMFEALQNREASPAATFAQCYDETMTEIEDEASGKLPRGIEIQRLPDWNEVVGNLRPGEVTILAARPSMGKTAVGLGVALGAAQAGAGTLFISLEMSKKELTKRAITDLIFAQGESASFDNVQKGKFTAFDRERLADARAAIENWPLILDDPATLRIGTLAMRIRRFKRRMAAKGQDLKVVIIDYLGLIHADNTRGSRYEQVSEVSRTVKRVAKECGVHIVLLSQLSRAVEQREDKRPVLSDLRDSGDIEQDADNVCFIFREEYYLERSEPDPSDKKRADWETRMDAARDRLELISAKRRQGRIGKRLCFFFGAHQAVRGHRFYQDMRV